MNPLALTRFRAQLLPKAAAAGVLCLGTVGAMAQDCKLIVDASPNVVYPGQTASVNVLAAFPLTDYAFASAMLNVFSTHPAWTSASGGVVVGDDVFNINSGQAHAPQQGMFAAPTNPYRVWLGGFSPAAASPALVQFAADPQTFSIYPSRLTSSIATCAARGGSDFIFVNPLRVGRWLAAPGRDTKLRVSDDVIVDGLIITGENPAPAILIGLLLPAVQTVRESASRVSFDRVPDSYATGVQVVDDSGRPHEMLLLSFTKVDFDNASSMLGLSAEVPPGRPAVFRALRRGEMVATGEVDATRPEGGPPGLLMPSVPPQAAAIAGPRTQIFDGRDIVSQLTWTLTYDEPTTIQVLGRDGRYGGVVVDMIEVIVPLARSAARPQTSNNLKQLSLGCHTYYATGVGSMRVTPAQPR